MRNLLVTKNYTILDHSKWTHDRSNESNLVEDYNKMETIMIDTAKQNLIDLDDVIVHRGEVDNIREAFRIHFLEIYDLWKSEPCNILYCDCDVIFLKEVKFFNEFNFFAMFNLAQTHGPRYDEYYQVTIEPYFNCGIRYYPYDMKQEIWDIGLKMVDNWNYNIWDSEQVIYNVMLHSQKIETSLYYRPYLAFQLLYRELTSEENTYFNALSIKDASVVHVHASGGSADRLETMQQLRIL